MIIENSMSDDIVLEELGKRISRYRLNKNMTQESLAKEAGISLPTVQRIENGQSTNLTNFIRVLRALKLLDSFSTSVPQPPVSPVLQIKSGKKIRHRASSKQENSLNNILWEWDNQDDKR